MINNRIRSRAGVTLMELLVALLVGALVMQIALAFFARQGRSFSNGVTAMGTMQNARYAINAMEKDVRTMGIGVVARQPSLVYAGPDVVAFNANYASNLSNDINAVYVDVSAPAGQVEAATSATRFTIPMTSAGYPDTNYDDGGSNSPAETISFFFQPDPTTTRGDDYVLYRQVNGTTPAVVSRNLLKVSGANFLEYMAVEVPADSATRMVTLGSGPFRHSAAVHGSDQDVGAAAKVDSIRAVRVRYSVTSGTAGPADPVRTVNRVIRMPNAGLAVRSVCGDAPQATALVATVVTLPDGSKAIRLAWSPSVDESAGEADVLRYVVWRRLNGQPLGDPFVSIPAGGGSYTYVDQSVTPGLPGVPNQYQYALAAQDCTPARSTQSFSGTVPIS